MSGPPQGRPQVAHPNLVVVDDASPIPFPDVPGTQVVRRGCNGGFGSAVNSGAAVAAGDLLLVLNSDLQVPEDFIDRLLEAHARFPRAVLSPRVCDEAGHATWVGRDFPRVSHHVVEWLTPLARWRHTTAWHRGVGHVVRPPDEDATVDWVMGAALLIPLAEFRSVGGFDERFFMNSEEIDLQRRLRHLGIVSVALSSPSVIHTGGGSTPSHRRREWLTTSRLLYADKWGSRRRLQLALLGATVANLAANTVRALLGRDIHPLVTAREELRLLRGRR
jgi:N-acetylglucosaminyl-diphospho-decaprenol L-rhamnosyltransferase